jgi:collagenase-like PrtC family protease
MHNLASTYSALGRHADAVAMGEKALEFRRRVLPANHPQIGEGCEGRDALHAMW